MNSLKTVLRGLQTHFPVLNDTKFWMQRTYRTLRRRPFEADFTLLRFLEIGADRVLLDIGSNRGQSIDAMRLYFPDRKIIGFDANKLLAARLVRRFARDRQVEINAFGLGETPSQSTLYIPFYRNWMFDGLASLDRDEAAGWLNEERMPGFDPKLLRIDEQVCEVRRLDDLGLAPGFVKIDVQGFEEQVVNGGAETLRRCTPVLLLETGGVVPHLLTELGYGEYAYHGDRLSKVTCDADRGSNSFFLTPDHVAALKTAGLGVPA